MLTNGDFATVHCTSPLSLIICCYGLDQSPNNSCGWVLLWSGRQVWIKAPRWDFSQSTRSGSFTHLFAQVYSCKHMQSTIYTLVWNSLFSKTESAACYQRITPRAAYSNSTPQATWSSLTHWKTTTGVRHIQLKTQFYIWTGIGQQISDWFGIP